MLRRVLWGLVIVVALAAITLAVSNATGCAPSLGSGTSSRGFHATVQNTSSSPVTISLSGSNDGFSSAGVYVTIPAHGSSTWSLGDKTPDRLWLHNPLTWAPVGYGNPSIYDQIYRTPTDYAADARSVTLWYP